LFTYFFQQAKAIKGSQKVDILNPICPNTLTFGECTIRNCIERYAFVKEDISNIYFSKDGIIKFKIVNIFSPIYYSIKILQHQSKNENDWVME
jgi:hypothetical protein